MSAPRKIFISGTSGAGKTTLAQYISLRYRIPFVSTSAKELWPCYGVDSHKEMVAICNENSKIASEFQYRLLELRQQKLEGLDEFVTDRSPLDNLVYYMMQCSSQDKAYITADYIGLCEGAYPWEYTQIYLTSNVEHLEDDGHRINNRYYQMMVDALFMYYIENHWVCEPAENRVIKTITEWDWETRVKKVEKLLTHKTSSQKWQNIKTKLRL